MERNQKVLLDAPYYSQHLHVQDSFWQTRACGIVCLKMAMDNFKPTSYSIDELINIANKRGGFGEFGWIHDFMIDIARSFGFSASRKEWKSEEEHIQELLINEAVGDFVGNLSQGFPIIISTTKNFAEPSKFHQVLLTGFEMKEDTILGFFYHDPDAMSEEAGKHNFVPIDAFKNYWRKLAIYVRI